MVTFGKLVAITGVVAALLVIPLLYVFRAGWKNYLSRYYLKISDLEMSSWGRYCRGEKDYLGFKAEIAEATEFLWLRDSLKSAVFVATMVIMIVVLSSPVVAEHVPITPRVSTILSVTAMVIGLAALMMALVTPVMRYGANLHWRKMRKRLPQVGLESSLKVVLDIPALTEADEPLVCSKSDIKLLLDNELSTLTNRAALTELQTRLSSETMWYELTLKQLARDFAATDDSEAIHKQLEQLMGGDALRRQKVLTEKIRELEGELDRATWRAQVLGECLAIYDRLVPRGRTDITTTTTTEEPLSLAAG